MKFYQSKIILFLAFFGLITSCEKEIKLKESEVKARIVINSIFVAEDTLLVNLSESRNILFNNGGDLPFINNGTVVLKDNNGNTVGNLVHSELGNYYLASPFPESGKTYKIEVTAPNFDAVSAVTTVPSSLGVVTLDTLSTGIDKMRISVTLTDNPNEKNYYSMTVLAIETYTFEISPGVFNTDTEINGGVCSKDVNVQGTSADEEGDKCAEELFFSDALFNGGTHTFKLDKWFNAKNADTMIVKVRSVSEDLFKYKTSLQKYNETSGNPFGEPVQVFTNITNGFGIFSGYSEYIDTLILE